MLNEEIAFGSFFLISVLAMNRTDTNSYKSHYHSTLHYMSRKKLKSKKAINDTTI